MFRLLHKIHSNNILHLKSESIPNAMTIIKKLIAIDMDNQFKIIKIVSLFFTITYYEVQKIAQILLQNMRIIIKECSIRMITHHINILFLIIISTCIFIMCKIYQNKHFQEYENHEKLQIKILNMIKEENGFLVFDGKRKNAHFNPLINSLFLQNSQKKDDKNFPDIIVTSNYDEEVVIIIECKQNHSQMCSKTLNHPESYALDSALNYSENLLSEYNVIAIGITEQGGKLKVIAYKIKKNLKKVRIKSDKLMKMSWYFKKFK